MLFLPTRGAVGMLPIISIVTQPSAALDANAAPSSVPYYNDSRSEFNKNRISTKRFKSRQTAANRQMTRRGKRHSEPDRKLRQPDMSRTQICSKGVRTTRREGCVRGGNARNA